MVSFWTYIGIVVASLISGFITFALSYLLWNVIVTAIRKKRIPRDPEDRKTKFLDGGDSQINEKEVEVNEREQISKLREFERLRRSIRQKYSGELDQTTQGSGGDEQSKRGRILPPLPDIRASGNTPRTEKPQRKLKLEY